MIGLIIKALKAALNLLSKSQINSATSIWMYQPEMPRSMRDE
ncbi:MAG: cyclic lactone autoinducer peptide [Clostridia bacterium]|nr:cyclic lactone autoinducer peptide [Clostridia bacterium]